MGSATWSSISRPGSEPQFYTDLLGFGYRRGGPAGKHDGGLPALQPAPAIAGRRGGAHKRINPSCGCNSRRRRLRATSRGARGADVIDLAGQNDHMVSLYGHPSRSRSSTAGRAHDRRVVLAGRALRLRRVDLGPPGATSSRPDGTHDRGRGNDGHGAPRRSPAAWAAAGAEANDLPGFATLVRAVAR